MDAVRHNVLESMEGEIISSEMIPQQQSAKFTTDFYRNQNELKTFIDDIATHAFLLEDRFARKYCRLNRYPLVEQAHYGLYKAEVFYDYAYIYDQISTLHLRFTNPTYRTIGGAYSYEVQFENV